MSNKWGQGWDYTFKEIWHNLDLIREDNLLGKYDNQNIDFCFNYFYSLLIKEILPKIREAEWEKKEKLELFSKTEQIIGLFKEALTYPDKVIAINMAEQFLRAMY